MSFSVEANVISLQPHYLLKHPTGVSKKKKKITGVDCYDFQLKQTVHHLPTAITDLKIHRRSPLSVFPVTDTACWHLH